MNFTNNFSVTAPVIYVITYVIHLNSIEMRSFEVD